MLLFGGGGVVWVRGSRTPVGNRSIMSVQTVIKIRNCTAKALIPRAQIRGYYGYYSKRAIKTRFPEKLAPPPRRRRRRGVLSVLPSLRLTMTCGSGSGRRESFLFFFGIFGYSHSLILYSILCTSIVYPYSIYMCRYTVLNIYTSIYMKYEYYYIVRRVVYKTTQQNNPKQHHNNNLTTQPPDPLRCCLLSDTNFFSLHCSLRPTWILPNVSDPRPTHTTLIIPLLCICIIQFGHLRGFSIFYFFIGFIHFY